MTSGMVRASFWAKEKARSFNRAFSRVLICVTLASFCGDCLIFLGLARHSLSGTPINRGWRILEAVQQFPPEEQESVAAEMLSAVREIDQLDAEADRRHKIAGLFCKVYEKAVLLTPTEENVRIWTECTRMTKEDIEDSVQDSYELAQTFQTIGDLLKNAISCVHQWPDAPSDKGQG